MNEALGPVSAAGVVGSGGSGLPLVVAADFILVVHLSIAIRS